MTSSVHPRPQCSLERAARLASLAASMRGRRVEKIPGGELEECEVLQGVMFNKDVTHHKMRKDIKNPRVSLIDCPLEYKKNESNTNVEITNESDWEAMLMQEEEEVQKLCDDLIKLKPDVVMTEKGVSDLAQHFLLKANIAVIRRIRKTDNNRVAKACGATIANRTDELTEEDVGKGCGLFKIRVALPWSLFFSAWRTIRAAWTS